MWIIFSLVLNNLLKVFLLEILFLDLYHNNKQIEIMKKTVITLGLLLLLTSCADKTEITQVMTTHQYGFWGGVWHGIIAPFDFIGSLIWDDVSVYAENNNGGWYSFGFLLGIGAFSGGASKTIK